jgi:hypothetical protein
LFGFWASMAKALTAMGAAGSGIDGFPPRRAENWLLCLRHGAPLPSLFVAFDPCISLGARLLRQRGGRLVLLVSDRAHLMRAALLFGLADLRVAGMAGVPPPLMLREIDAVVRECIALPRSLARALRRGRLVGH